MASQEKFDDIFITCAMHTGARGIQEFSLNTYYLETICDEIVAVLKSVHGIEITDKDTQTLKLVSYLQLEAKICKAREDIESIEQIMQRVETTILKYQLALFPIEFYLKQIGQFEFESFKFIPKLFSVKFRENLISVSNEDLHSDYEDLMDRISKAKPILKDAFCPINFTAPGTKAQLVTSIKNNNFPDSYDIWCNKNIDETNLKIGGFLQFGFQLNQDIDRKFELSCVSTTIHNVSKNAWFIRKMANYPCSDDINL